MRLDPFHPRVTEVYDNKPVRMLLLLDIMYENYKEKKKELDQKMTSDGKRVVNHFSMREDEMTDYELFDEDDEDDTLNVSFMQRTVDEEFGDL